VEAAGMSPTFQSARSWRVHGHRQGIGLGLSPSSRRRLGLGHGGLVLDFGGVAAALGAGVLVERVGG
jgi:hypothetical protein